MSVDVYLEVQVDPTHLEGLQKLGWNAVRGTQVEQGLEPARVTAEHRGSYVVHGVTGEVKAELTGRFRHEARRRSDLPAVGDWVGVKRLPGEDRVLVHQVLPRTSAFLRKVAGDETEEQLIAANVDVAVLVMALDQDLNLRRAERYLTMAWESGAVPAVVLSKADLTENVEEAVAQVASVAPGAPVLPVSVVTDAGLAEVRALFDGDRTGVLMGSSGVGKSTLVNRLLGEAHQAVKAIRADGKGRHTTTHRELLLVPGGGVVIDTPGMRELQLWEADEGLEAAFDDVAGLAAGCRFNDCRHDGEPGCEVLAAIADGRLSEDRFESYRKLQRELAFLERKKDKRLASEDARRWKKVSVEARTRARNR